MYIEPNQRTSGDFSVHYSEVNFDLCNRFATSIDTLLEDEEQFADQLKEYYSFGDSLR